MTHSPPVPPGNQSPYPLQEPPHEHQATPPDVAARRDHSHANEPVVSGAALGIGVVIGLGSAALLATWLFSRKEEPKPKTRSRTAKSGSTGGRPKSPSSTGSRAKSSGSTSGGRARSTTTRRRKTTSDSE